MRGRRGTGVVRGGTWGRREGVQDGSGRTTGVGTDQEDRGGPGGPRKDGGSGRVRGGSGRDGG